MITELNSHLLGCILRSFRLVAGGTLLLYFSRDTSTERKILWVDCAWRLADGEQLIAGSLDPVEKLLQMLLRHVQRRLEDGVEMSIHSIYVDPLTGDLALRIGESLLIETFSSSRSHEQWELRENGRSVICFGQDFSPVVRIEPSPP